MASKFTEAYSEIVNGLASRAFSVDGDWQKLIVRARKLAAVDGFDVGEAEAVDDLRKKLEKATGKGIDEAISLFAGGGETLSGTGANALVDAALAKRLGALKSLRHTYLLKRFGGHKVWCVNIPMSFTDWPHAALAGNLAQATVKLNDRNERFSVEQRKDLGNGLRRRRSSGYTRRCWWPAVRRVRRISRASPAGLPIAPARTRT